MASICQHHFVTQQHATNSISAIYSHDMRLILLSQLHRNYEWVISFNVGGTALMLLKKVVAIKKSNSLSYPRSLSFVHFVGINSHYSPKRH